MLCGPVGEETGGVGVQGDIAVVVELADGNPQPGCPVEHDDGVTGERAQLTDSHPGPRQQLDHESFERHRNSRGGCESGGLGVVEEPWQWVISDRGHRRRRSASASARRPSPTR